MSNAAFDVSSISTFLGQAGMPTQTAPASQPAATTAAPATGTTGATTTSGNGQAVPGTSTGAGPGALFMPLMLLAVFALMIVPTIFAGRKEKKRREAMMSGLSKGDKVATSAGIVGTISEISDTEVVIRSEDSRLRFSKSAIASVMSSNSKGSGATSSIEAKDGKAVGV